MSVKILQWSQQVLVPHPSSGQRCLVINGGGGGGGGFLECRFARKWDRPTLLQRSRSCESTLSTSKFMIKRTSTARFFSFSDEEFPENIAGDYDDHGSNATESCSDEESSDEKDGDGRLFDRLNLNHPTTILPDGGAQLSEQEERMKQLREEASLWRPIVEEAWEMEGEGLVDRETRKRFVSPVRVEIEPDDDYEDYLDTEAVYLAALSTEPHNPLLLANYAQFLCLVVRDYDRAEEWFERAVMVEEEDAEAYRKYGEFLWKVRVDLLGADSALFEAFCIEPNNTFLADYYAHFLWITFLYN